MLAALLNIFRIPDLRKKVFITLALFVVYRMGSFVPTPGVNPAAMQDFFSGQGSGGDIFSVVNMFSGGAFHNMTIFALGIMPYISASIIIQILAVVWPALEKIRREGESGQRKITQMTRYGTVALSLFQGFGIGLWLLQKGVSEMPSPIMFLFFTALTMSTGTCFIMWLGEKISAHGIGNGISLIITIGIIARYPADIGLAIAAIKADTMSPMGLIAVLVMMVAVSALIVFSVQATRKIPVQHARRMMGRRMVQGGNTNIPLKLNTAGVIPVIFSSAILTFPLFITPYLGATISEGLQNWIGMASPHNPYDLFNLDQGGLFSLLKVINLYTIFYIILTAFFCFFYTAITLNPVDLADNLKKSGAFVPGIKPGKHTADYIDHVLVRITVVGAAFLIVVALVPDVLSVAYGIPYGIASIAGGTVLIIVVGVVQDTMKQIESQLLMRHYEGFTRTNVQRGRRQAVRLR